MKKKWMWGFLVLSSVVYSNDNFYKNLFNKRYCEIILFRPTEGWLVFNTITQNDCPKNQWNSLSISQVKSTAHAWSVNFNGPRFWVIDEIKNSSFIDNELLDLNGFKLNKAAKFSLFSFIKIYLQKQKPYQIYHIHRNTTWVYHPGRRVYELIDENNQAYVMQSYSIQYQTQTLKSLDNLATQLHLPKNWKYKTGVLKKTQTLTAIDDNAYIVQDDFHNTYQRASHDLLDEN